MRSAAKLLVLLLLATAVTAQQPQQPRQLPQADERYKADILLVVAHPDDEGAATPYLARAIDEGKRVAVVYTTHGSSGGNEAGSEQAAALGEIREIEARRANAYLGITNVWFLSGKDTASQNVLQSLANWGHGESLQELVRLVRLTRPAVILTFLPGTFVGEDHGDHQAAGVLATEAFDLAGDPTVFPEQVAGPSRRLETFLENLRPWQTQKIYYFPDADREDIFLGLGPKYSVKDLSKSTSLPYWRMALNSFLMHQTQAKGYIDSISKMSDAEVEKQVSSEWGEAQHFVLGKSLVGGSVTGDIFEGVKPDAIPFVPPERPASCAAVVCGYCGACRTLGILRGLSPCARLATTTASRASGDRSAIRHYAGDSTVAAEFASYAAENHALRRLAIGLDHPRRRGHRSCRTQASRGCAH